MMKITNHLVQNKHQNLTLDRLVENRRIYQADNAELNVYETFTTANAVDLQFSNPVLVSMLQGKKVMHFEEEEAFDFFPGQSILLPAEKTMRIDFPEAQADKPTRCLALAINPELISKTLDFLNEYHPRLAEKGDWQTPSQNFFLLHDQSFDANMHKIVQIFLEQHEAKSALLDLSLQAMIVRLLKTRARNTLLKHCQQNREDCRLAAIVAHIEENMDREISVDELCQKAHLSKPQLFRYFKNEVGSTPVEFMNECRISRAKKILRDPQKTIKDACYETGYNSVSYFTKVFKKFTGFTPKQYKSS